MCEPSAEPLPWGSPFLVYSFRELERVFLVVVEHVGQLFCHVFVDDGDILLIVAFQAACIKVCRAYGAEFSVDHDDLCVVESGLIDPHLAAFLLQFVDIVEDTVRSQRDVAWLGNHNLYYYASLHCADDGFLIFGIRVKYGFMSRIVSCAASKACR